MTPSEPIPPLPFRISSTSILNEEVQQLIKAAIERGNKHAVLQALRQIVDRLISNPHEFGECRYRLPLGKLSCHIGAVAPIAVRFAIHKESRTVPPSPSPRPKEC